MTKDDCIGHTYFSLDDGVKYHDSSHWKPYRSEDHKLQCFQKPLTEFISFLNEEMNKIPPEFKGKAEVFIEATCDKPGAPLITFEINAPRHVTDDDIRHHKYMLDRFGEAIRRQEIQELAQLRARVSELSQKYDTPTV